MSFFFAACSLFLVCLSGPGNSTSFPETNPSYWPYVVGALVPRQEADKTCHDRRVHFFIFYFFDFFRFDNEIHVALLFLRCARSFDHWRDLLRSHMKDCYALHGYEENPLESKELEELDLEQRVKIFSFF